MIVSTHNRTNYALAPIDWPPACVARLNIILFTSNFNDRSRDSGFVLLPIIVVLCYIYILNIISLVIVKWFY